MYFDDHRPAHFHAIYGEHEAHFAIDTLAVLEGGLPRRVTALVLEWANLHRGELRENWERALRHDPLKPVASLDE